MIVDFHPKKPATQTSPAKTHKKTDNTISAGVLSLCMHPDL